MQNDILEKFRNRCVRDRKSNPVVHEIIPRSRLLKWDVYGNQVPLCAECHEWAHSIGTEKSGKILRKFRDLRLLEYGLIMPPEDISSFIDKKEEELNKSYSKILIFTESEWKLLAETLRHQKLKVEELSLQLELENDDWLSD